MCSPKILGTPRKRFGFRLWYFIKIAEFILVAVCIILLIINEHLHGIYDDFTPVYPEQKNVSTDKPADKKKPSLFHPAIASEGMLVVNKSNGTDHNLDMLLSSVIVLYPSCTTAVIFFSMELLAQLCTDPLNKISNLIIIAVCMALSIVVFVQSLISAINTVHVSLILVTILSAVLIILVIIDFVLLALS